MAKETSSRSKAGMSGGKKSSSKGKGKHPHETHIKHFAHGGHVVTHHFKGDDGESMEPEEHVMADKEALMQHLSQAVPDNGPAQASAPSPDMSAGGPPAPAPAGPPQGAPPQGM